MSAAFQQGRRSATCVEGVGRAGHFPAFMGPDSRRSFDCGNLGSRGYVFEVAPSSLCAAGSQQEECSGGGAWWAMSNHFEADPFRSLNHGHFSAPRIACLNQYIWLSFISPPVQCLLLNQNFNGPGGPTVFLTEFPVPKST